MEHLHHLSKVKGSWKMFSEVTRERHASLDYFANPISSCQGKYTTRVGTTQ